MKKDKKLNQAIWGVALVLMCGLSAHAWAEETATQLANGNFVPVVSADKSSGSPAANNPLSSQAFEESSVLTPPDHDLTGTTPENPTLKDTIKNLGLNENETKTFISYSESALKSIDSFFSAEKTSVADFDKIEKQFRALSDFAEKHSENKNVVQAVATVINSFFEHLEKRLTVSEKENKGSVLAVQPNLLQGLMETEEKEKNNAILAMESYQGLEAIEPVSPDATRKHDQAMDSVLEILRKGSMDSQTPAFSRAVYRSWYLSLSKKARDVRLNRLRTLVLHQQNAESPGASL